MDADVIVVGAGLAGLVAGMNELTDEPLLDVAVLQRQIVARDREIDNPFSKDLQVTAIYGARRYRGGKSAPHRTGSSTRATGR